jgi:hypothetical protein
MEEVSYKLQSIHRQIRREGQEVLTDAVIILYGEMPRASYVRLSARSLGRCVESSSKCTGLRICEQKLRYSNSMSLVDKLLSSALTSLKLRYQSGLCNASFFSLGAKERKGGRAWSGGGAYGP